MQYTKKNYNLIFRAIKSLIGHFIFSTQCVVVVLLVEYLILSHNRMHNDMMRINKRLQIVDGRMLDRDLLYSPRTDSITFTTCI